MFERFTDRARQAIVLAQEEARALRHSYIGTEHLLLGLLAGDGIAAKALQGLGVEKEAFKAALAEEVGVGPSAPGGKIPFTPRAKRTMEQALRQALAWGHNYIGTEHLLVGLVADDGALATKLLAEGGVDQAMVNAKVLELLKGIGATPEPPTKSWRLPETVRRQIGRMIHDTDVGADVLAPGPVEGPVCPSCGAGLGDNLAADVIPAVGPIERIFVVAYCRGCGHTLNILPDD